MQGNAWTVAALMVGAMWIPVGGSYKSSLSAAETVRAVAVEQVFEGKVKSATGKSIIIREKDGDSLEFSVTGETTITLDGKAVSLDNLDVDFLVKITAKKVETKFTATKIEARKPE